MTPKIPGCVFATKSRAGFATSRIGQDFPTPEAVGPHATSVPPDASPLHACAPSLTCREGGQVQPPFSYPPVQDEQKWCSLGSQPALLPFIASRRALLLRCYGKGMSTSCFSQPTWCFVSTGLDREKWFIATTVAFSSLRGERMWLQSASQKWVRPPPSPQWSCKGKRVVDECVECVAVRCSSKDIYRYSPTIVTTW